MQTEFIAYTVCRVPKPVGQSEHLVVDSRDDEPYQFHLLGEGGREVMQTQYTGRQSIDVGDLAPGIYFYIIQSDTRINRGKIVIQ